MAKVLLLNGSPRANGCTAEALGELIRTFAEEGLETELIQVTDFHQARQTDYKGLQSRCAAF